MNLPNIITLSRIPLMFVIVGLMYLGMFHWTASAAFWLFILCAVGDWFDGYLARKRNLVSTFGKLMDALTDKIMVMGLVIALVEQQMIPVYLALITLCREFLVTGMRMVAASKGVIVAADRGGKSKTLTQLIALGFFLGAPMARRDWSRLFNEDLTNFSIYVAQIGLWIFIASTALSVWSGWRYIATNRKVFFSDANA